MPNAPQFTSNMGSANFYQPTWQGGADTMYQGLAQGFNNPWNSSGFQQSANNYMGLTNQFANSLINNPYGSSVQDISNWAAPQLSQLGNQGQFNGNNILDSGAAGLHATNQFLPEVFNFQYANPMIQGAQLAGGALQGVGQQSLDSSAGIQGLASSYAQPLQQYASGGLGQLQQLAGQTTSGLMPYAQQSAYSLPGLANQYAGPGNAAAQSILGTAFDPQGQLYSQQFQQNQDAVRANLAAAGLGTSGVGVGIMNQADQRFNTDWQNQQLARQTQGLSAYNANAASNYGMQSGAQQQGLAGLESAASGTFNPYSTTYGQGISGLGTAANTGFGVQAQAAQLAQQLGSAGAQDIATGAAMPWNASQNVMNNQLAQMGLLSNLSGAYSAQINTGLGTIGQGLQQRVGATQLPYDTYNGLLQNQISGTNNIYGGLSNFMGLAGQGNNINQSQMQSLLSYLSQGTNSASAYANAQNTLYQSQLEAAKQQSGGIGSLFGSLGNLASDFAMFA